jgi:transcriptional regulator with XRE-family HTH domain
MRRDPATAALIDAELLAISLEAQILRIMEHSNITATELAKKLNVPKSQVSRDLNGGLSKARLGRLHQIAAALNHDLVAVVVPQDLAKSRKKALLTFLDELDAEYGPVGKAAERRAKKTWQRLHGSRSTAPR